MARPLVSVITPVYNGEDYITDCVNSVARSVTCNRIEIEHIIVDDGSTDGTVRAIESAIDALPKPRRYQARLLRCGVNSGKPSYGRNRGIEMAKGRYIFCLDHDDVILQNALRYLAEHLETSEHHVTYGDFIRGDSVLGYLIGKDYYGWPHATMQDALYSIFKGDHFYQHSLMYTKGLWDIVGGYDEAITYGEDLDLCIRFILEGHLPNHLLLTTHVHRNHTTNLTADYQHKNDIWFAERRAHYHKYMHLLPSYLTPPQIVDIEKELRITPAVHLNGPPGSGDKRSNGQNGWLEGVRLGA